MGKGEKTSKLEGGKTGKRNEKKSVLKPFERGSVAQSVLYAINVLKPLKCDISEILEGSSNPPDKFKNLKAEINSISDQYLKARMSSKNPEVVDIVQQIRFMFSRILMNDDTLFILNSIKKLDVDTYNHSIHVGLLAIATGCLLRYEPEKIIKLGTGAILHDTGKLMISKDILCKPQRLSEEEFTEMQKHTTYGYEILKHCANIDDDCAYIAISHHERHDGSGYPLQLSGKKIHEAARIVAIADVYDALTSDRIYRKGVFPGKVMEQIAEMCPNHFDMQILKVFMKITSIYPTGTEVILNTNTKAKIIQQNSIIPTRPIIEIENVDSPIKIDLDINHDLYIVGLNEKN